MAAIAVTYTFTANTTINSGEANQNFSDLVNYINNRNDGTSTWDAVRVTSASAIVAILNNSTGTSDILNCRDNGTNVLVVADGGTTTITATAGGTTKALIVNNSTSTGNILELQDNGTNVLVVADGGRVSINDGTVSLPAYSFISDPDTGIYRSGANVMWLSAGGSNILEITTTAIIANADILPNDDASTQHLGSTTKRWLNIYMGDGSAAAPSYTFGSDLDTGIYRAGADQIGLAINGASGIQVSPTLIYLYLAGAAKITLEGTGFDPIGLGVLSSGTATNYWNDISYKTLTDRGCLPFVDDGVELQDGRIVSDCEALASIQKHPTKLTVHGLPMIDYKTLPKVSYKKADMKGELLPRDDKDEPIGGADGIEMTSVFGFMIGAIRELHNRVKILEAV